MAANRVEVEISDNENNSDKEGENGDVESEAGEEKSHGNEGWADAMAQVLQKQLQENRPVILAKYQKGNKRKAERKEETKMKKAKTQERHAILEKDHVIPEKSNLDYDRNLVQIATRGEGLVLELSGSDPVKEAYVVCPKPYVEVCDSHHDGVVKLFNAVSKHQKEMEAKLKKAPTEIKKSKVMESMTKSAFLDMLKSTCDKPRSDVTQQRSETTSRTNIDKEVTDDEKEGASSWTILRDDFMMGAKMKDWDRQDESILKKNKKAADLKDYELGNADGDDIGQSDDSYDSDDS